MLWCDYSFAGLSFGMGSSSDMRDARERLKEKKLNDLQRLKFLKELYDDGLITQDEFEAFKLQILNQ